MLCLRLVMNLLSQLPFFLVLFFLYCEHFRNPFFFSLFFLLGGGDCHDDKSVSSPSTTIVAGSHQASHGATIIRAVAAVHLAGDTGSKFAFALVLKNRVAPDPLDISSTHTTACSTKSTFRSNLFYWL